MDEQGDADGVDDDPGRPGPDDRADRQQHVAERKHEGGGFDDGGGGFGQDHGDGRRRRERKARESARRYGNEGGKLRPVEPARAGAQIRSGRLTAALAGSNFRLVTARQLRLRATRRRSPLRLILP